jgi:flagellar protein FliS
LEILISAEEIMTKEDIKGFSQRVAASNRTQLIVIMYEMELTHMQDALRSYGDGDNRRFRESLKQAKRVNDLLAASLDMNYDISWQLGSLYRFVGNALNEASLKLSTDGLDRVCGIVTKLKGTFEQVAATDKSRPLMGNTEQVYAGLTYSNGMLDEIAYDLSSSGKRGFTV